MDTHEFSNTAIRPFEYIFCISQLINNILNLGKVYVQVTPNAQNIYFHKLLFSVIDFAQNIENIDIKYSGIYRRNIRNTVHNRRFVVTILTELARFFVFRLRAINVQ